MFRSVLKPAARLVVGANVVAVTAATLALLPVSSAVAAGSGFVTAASPAVVNNTDTAKVIAFTTTDQFNNAVPPQVTATGPAGAGTYTANPVSVSADGHTVTATVNFAPGGVPAGPGDYSVEICQELATGCASSLDDVSDSTKPAILHVNASVKAQVTSLSTPVRATNADTTPAVTIQGFNFAKGDTVAFVPVHSGDTPPTFSVNGITASQITGTLGALLPATPGTYDAIITDTANQKSDAVAEDQLTVVVPPAVDSVSPAATVGIGAGQNGHPARTITIHVTDLNPSDGVSLSLPNGATDGLSATVQSVAAGSTAGITDVVVSIATSASTVAQPVTMTLTDAATGGHVGQTLTVTAAPTITAVSQPTVGQNSSNEITFTGSHFDAAPSLSFPAASGISFGGAAVITATTIKRVLLTSATAPTGKVAFTVLNSDGGATDYTGGSGGNSLLSVNPAPKLTSVDPGNVPQGATGQVVTLNGTGFVDGMTAKAPAGRGVTFGTVTVAGGSTTQATVPVTVTAAAGAGSVQVTLANTDGGASTSTGLLTIDDFAVSGISPTTAPNSSISNAVALTVGGTNIPTGTTKLMLTRLPDSGTDTTDVPPISVSPTSVTSSTWHGTANLVGTAAGTYQVQLVNGTHSGTCTCTFVISSAGAPTVTSVSPAAIGQGADTMLTITGTKFTLGAGVSFSKSASFEATGPAIVDSPTQIRVPIHVAANAPSGAANASNVTVTNPGSAPNTGSCTTCLTANAAPAITSFSPAALAQGAATTLTITGTGFSPQATLTFGSGVTATGSPTITSTQITVPVQVANGAPSQVPVTVKNPDLGVGSANLPINPGPAVSALSPAFVATDFSGTLTLTGSGFHDSATVSFPAASGVTVTSGQHPTVGGGGTTITVPITVQRADAAAVDVIVTNPDDHGTMTCAGCLGVAVAPVNPTGVTASRSGTTVTVAWTAVPNSGNGGAPISGYTVSVVDPANSGVAPMMVSASQTTASFTGLSSSTVYTFKVVATNKANLSSPGATAQETKQQAGTTLLLAHSTGHLVAGHALVLSGSLAAGNGSPIKNATITVAARNDAGHLRQVGTTTTGTGGRWSLTTLPKHNATYTAAFKGDAVHAAAASRALRTTVSPKVTISAKSSSSASHPLVVTGGVTPNKHGHKVSLIGVDAAGHKHLLGTATLDSNSHYRFSVKLAKGVWHLRVLIGKTQGNVAGHSRRMKVTRD